MPAVPAGMSHIQIPPGLMELLQGYTVEVLRQQPPDLVEFALDYFTRLREARDQAFVPSAAPPSELHEPAEPSPGPTADENANSDSEDDVDLEGRAGERVGVRGGAGVGGGVEGVASPGPRPGCLARESFLWVPGMHHLQAQPYWSTPRGWVVWWDPAWGRTLRALGPALVASPLQSFPRLCWSPCAPLQRRICSHPLVN